MEENRLPGRTAEEILCVPVFDSPLVTDDSRCLAVISLSCSPRNLLSKRHERDAKRYADKVRTLLLSFNSRILFDPDVNQGTRVITISGEVGSGKTTLLAELRGILQPAGWRVVSIGTKFRDFCAQRGLSVEEIDQLPDELHQQFDEEQEQVLKDMECILLESRLAGYLARRLGLADVLKVFCSLPFEDRIARIAERQMISREAARRLVQERDENDLDRYRRLYGVDDYREPQNYDLQLIMTRKPNLLAMDVTSAMRHEDERVIV